MPKLNKVPFEIRNEATETHHVLTLSGAVQKRYWRDDEVVDAKSVREALDGVDKPITIKLNSPGGDVFEGIEIYNYLKDHPQTITVEVTGVAASAASIIAMGADEVVMNVGTSLMIHEASTLAWGNKADIQKTLNALETIDDSLVAIYVERTGLDKETITDYLKAETWFTAEDAVEKGFANSVKAKEPSSVASKITTTVNIDTKPILATIEAMQKQLDEFIQAKQLTMTKQEEEPVEKPQNLMSKLRGGL